jgi:hypothetical protein
MYNAAFHQNFSDRVKAAMISLHDTINREMETIDDIYLNEAESGGHVDYTDTNNATEAEHTDAIIAIRAFQATLALELPRITPWLQ